MRRSQPPNGRERGLSRPGISPTCTSLPGQEASPPKSGGADRPAGTGPAKKTPDRTGRLAGPDPEFWTGWLDRAGAGRGTQLGLGVTGSFQFRCICVSFGGWPGPAWAYPPVPGRPLPASLPNLHNLPELAGPVRPDRPRPAGPARPGVVPGWPGTRPAGRTARPGPAGWASGRLGSCVCTVGESQPAGQLARQHWPSGTPQSDSGATICPTWPAGGLGHLARLAWPAGPTIQQNVQNPWNWIQLSGSHMYSA